MIDQYDWAGGREAMLRFGPADGPVVVVAMPLLEEWNRTRAFVVTLLRGLAERGVASVLPDLPGHGESLIPVAGLTVLRIAEALEAVADQLLAEGRLPLGLGVRSGALVDSCSLYLGRWYLAPVTGDEMLVGLHRTWLASGRRGSRETMMFGSELPIVIGGSTVSAGFLSSLICAEPDDQPGVARRVVRLATDPRPADLKVDGRPLWRHAEPGNDLALAATLAEDIAAWTKTCVA